jgi:hypothetical protein
LTGDRIESYSGAEDVCRPVPLFAPDVRKRQECDPP